jgi:hypothetical protein
MFSAVAVQAYGCKRRCMCPLPLYVQRNTCNGIRATEYVQRNTCNGRRAAWKFESRAARTGWAKGWPKNDLAR